MKAYGKWKLFVAVLLASISVGAWGSILLVERSHNPYRFWSETKPVARPSGGGVKCGCGEEAQSH